MNDAERLANILETDEFPSDRALKKAAAKLRRLVAINAELAGALELIRENPDSHLRNINSVASAALEKAKQ